MASLNEKQISVIKKTGDVDIIQKSFQGDTSKYLFPTQLDKYKFETTELYKLDKELQLERDLCKERVQNIIQIRRKVMIRIKELRGLKKNVK